MAMISSFLQIIGLLCRILSLTNRSHPIDRLCWRPVNFDDCLIILIYGVASVSRIDQIVGLFCRRALRKRRYSIKLFVYICFKTNIVYDTFVLCVVCCVLHFIFKKKYQNNVFKKKNVFNSMICNQTYIVYCTMIVCIHIVQDKHCV